MSSTYGEKIKISVFGESHGNGIGVVIDGLSAGAEIDMDGVLAQMKRRAPGRDKTATPRKESDLPGVLSEMIMSGKVRLRWVDDLKPHKKYFFAFKEYPNDLVITIDDDVLYLARVQKPVGKEEDRRDAERQDDKDCHGKCRVENFNVAHSDIKDSKKVFSVNPAICKVYLGV